MYTKLNYRGKISFCLNICIFNDNNTVSYICMYVLHSITMHNKYRYRGRIHASREILKHDVLMPLKD